MAVRVFVVDRTGSGRPPTVLFLEEGKINPTALRQRCAEVLSLTDSVRLMVEVLDSGNRNTKRICAGCTLFLSRKEDDQFQELLDGIGELGDDILQGIERIFGKKKM
jgi:hypothetical protein